MIWLGEATIAMHSLLWCHSKIHLKRLEKKFLTSLKNKFLLKIAKTFLLHNLWHRIPSRFVKRVGLQPGTNLYLKTKCHCIFSVYYLTKDEVKRHES